MRGLAEVESPVVSTEVALVRARSAEEKAVSIVRAQGPLEVATFHLSCENDNFGFVSSFILPKINIFIHAT